jgi:hypothetical protein
MSYHIVRVTQFGRHVTVLGRKMAKSCNIVQNVGWNGLARDMLILGCPFIHVYLILGVLIMSQFPGQHLVTAFVSGTSKALPNNRLAKVGYKQTKAMVAKGLAAPKSICVSVPFIDADRFTEEEIFTKLVPHIQNLLAGAQDGLIRVLYESAKFSLSSVTDEEISIEKCIAFLEEQEIGGRLTIDSVKEWFTSEMAGILGEYASKMLAPKFQGTDLETKTQQVLNGYQGMFTALSGGKTYYPPEKRKNLLDALALTNDDDEIAGKLATRLQAMEKQDAVVAETSLIDFGI